MAKDTSRKKVRKNISRTFDRTPKVWLAQLTGLPKPSSDAFLRLRRDVLCLSRADASRLLRVARNTVWDWETDYRAPPFAAYLALRLVADAMRHHLSGDPWRSGVALAGYAAPYSEPVPLSAQPLDDPSRQFVSRRERAARLRARMAQFSTIYNAGYMVRDAMHGPDERRQDYAWRFLAVLQNEVKTCHDAEALIYAVADAITASPHGVPWEG